MIVLLSGILALVGVSLCTLAFSNDSTSIGAAPPNIPGVILPKLGSPKAVVPTPDKPPTVQPPAVSPPPVVTSYVDPSGIPVAPPGSGPLPSVSVPSPVPPVSVPPVMPPVSVPPLLPPITVTVTVEPPPLPVTSVLPTGVLP